MRWEQIIGLNIRRLRLTQGLTQEALAAHVFNAPLHSLLFCLH